MNASQTKTTRALKLQPGDCFKHDGRIHKVLEKGYRGANGLGWFVPCEASYLGHKIRVDVRFAEADQLVTLR